MIVMGRSTLECGVRCEMFIDCYGYNFNAPQKLCSVFRGYMVGQAVVDANYRLCRLAFYT